VENLQISKTLIFEQSDALDLADVHAFLLAHDSRGLEAEPSAIHVIVIRSFVATK